VCVCVSAFVCARKSLGVGVGEAPSSGGVDVLENVCGGGGGVLCGVALGWIMSTCV